MIGQQAALAIMAICLIFCVLAMAGVSAVLCWILYKRIAPRDDRIAADYAERLVTAWNAGYDTHARINEQAEGTAQIELQRRRGHQNWNPAADDADQRTQPDYDDVAVFGTDPVPA